MPILLNVTMHVTYCHILTRNSTSKTYQSCTYDMILIKIYGLYVSFNVKYIQISTLMLLHGLHRPVFELEIFRASEVPLVYSNVR